MHENAPMSDNELETQPQGKRPYVAPEVVVYGNVAEFTRGSGTSRPDGNRTTRKRKP